MPCRKSLLTQASKSIKVALYSNLVFEWIYIYFWVVRISGFQLVRVFLSGLRILVSLFFSGTPLQKMCGKPNSLLYQHYNDSNSILLTQNNDRSKSSVANF